MSHQVVVLIFVHKASLEWYEVISLRQCFRILSRYPIRLVCPAAMDTGAYYKVVPELTVDRVPARWLASIEQYNRLKMLPYLYRRYSQFEFMLTYELDAFVFRDELEAWCGQGWDFVGAPWFEGYDKATPDARPCGVGNSGFSLRRTSAMLKVGRTLRYQRKPIELIRDWRDGRAGLKGLVSALTYRNNFFGSLNDYAGQEDKYWCEIVAQRFAGFRVAPYDRARMFSFEVNPSRLFSECDRVLPFGCHKWMQYEPEFWRSHIEEFGYALPASRVAAGADTVVGG